MLTLLCAHPAFSAGNHLRPLLRARSVVASTPSERSVDVSGAAVDIAESLRDSKPTLAPESKPLHVPRVDHLTDWLPELGPLPTPFHGGCMADVNTLEDDECVLPGAQQGVFVDERTAVLADPVVSVDLTSLGALTAWKAGGPREDVFFAPEEVKAAIVTCGGLCPGLNTVLRELVSCLRSQYSVDSVFGVRSGYMGFYTNELEPLQLRDVETIHRQAGTVLGSSRGGHDTTKICDAIEAAGINLVFTIGGDGTMAGSNALATEFRRRRKKVAIAHVPKSALSLRTRALGIPPCGQC
jgi:6-phosphofructokinase 1